MDNQQHEAKPDTIEVTFAAMERLGEATAAAIAAEAGFAYSTVTPKLRALEDAGRAERLRPGEGRPLWRLTPAEQVADAPPASVVDTTPGEEADDKQAGPASTEEIAAADDDGVDDGDEAAEPADDEKSRPRSGKRRRRAASTSTSTSPRADLASDQAADSGADPAQPATTRRGKGALREAVLKVLQEHPDTAYKVGELSKLLDGASQGAIANALHKLTGEATVTQTVERPATFQAA